MSLPQVLFIDGLSPEGKSLLKPYEGKVFDLEVYETLTPEELAKKIATVSVLCVRTKTSVTRELLDKAKVLRLIGRAGTGVDHIDVQAARERGIAVMTTGDANSTSVAELTLGFALSFSRNLRSTFDSMKNDQWTPRLLQGFELSQKTFGIVGFGRIGSRVARRLTGFDLRVIACDPYISPERADRWGVPLLPLKELLAPSDFVSLHIPLTNKTHHLINSKTLKQMKPGAFLINTARGEVVCEPDLLSALDNGDLAGYAADVFSQEPLPADHPFRNHPKILLSPHFGAQTIEAQKRVNEAIARQVLIFLTTGQVQNPCF